MSFVYANPGSGPSAGGIGWFDFGSLTLNPGQSATGLTGTLNDGTKVTFDIKSIATSIVPFTANSVPRPFSFFGNIQYSGILGNVALTTPLLASYSNNSTLEISNIVVKDVNGNIITNYTAVIADAESTNNFPQYTEHLTFTTTGGPWNLLSTIGPNPPTISGVGSTSVTITGTNQSSQAAYVLTSTSPSMLTLETFGREAVAIGFATTRVTVKKNIGARINSADQFNLNIAGTPNNQIFTTGSSNGIQPLFATIYGTAGNTYTINEAMAPGSVSTLTDYTIATSATNLTPGGQVPPTGNLPINVTPQLGDNIVYTITNAAPEKFTKTVDKANAIPGDILTYTITGTNPNNFAINNVLVTDATPIGTTYVGNLLVSTPYTGTNPNSGITLTTVPANGTVTISYQVKVNTNNQTNLINNVATVTGPSGIPANTNIVTTAINNADISSPGNFLKTVDKANAIPGDILTYTLTLNNTGNASANNVVLTDIIPTGTTYVNGSVTATLPFTGDPNSTINLTAPIAPTTTETITFKVKVNNGNPITNPLLNKADVKYTFTVDPNNPNGVSKNGTSNTVTTNVINAKTNTIKTVDQTISYIGQILTYNIAITNTGNTPLNNVIITDQVPNGTIYIPGSLTVNVPFTGTPLTGINLTNALMPGTTASISFQVKVTSMPNPNPINNKAIVNYKYTLDQNNPNGANGTDTSNIANTLIFRNNYQQQINDLIASVALEQAALASIANSEGAKIQQAIKLGNISANELMCINKSVQDMLDSISTLENILKQKLNIVNCQINGCTCC
ncbi:MAG: hypothetical protein RR703_03150 [Bacilli bacterium]